jgi:hypothetical protein
MKDTSKTTTANRSDKYTYKGRDKVTASQYAHRCDLPTSIKEHLKIK